MKSFLAVEATRRAYYEDATRNSVHRSSLTVPEIAGAEAEISFLNHFLLKRGYDNVACRVSAVDESGARIGSRLLPIVEPRVYGFALGGLFQGRAASYLVEFFAAHNLFIPFPAVMVNHRGRKFLNSVHAYNRVLNDVFEDDSINASHQREASIDVRVDSGTDTVVLLAAGAGALEGACELELATAAGRRRSEVAVTLPRFGHRWLSLRDTLPGAGPLASGVLKVKAPRQPMFYGRLLAGQRSADGAWSANHSYYDSSGTAEYWGDDSESERLYPFFPGLENRVRMYPIMSPSRLGLDVAFHGRDGRRLARVPAGELTCPGDSLIDVDVGALAGAAGLEPSELAAFAVITRPRDGKSPTRVNHQLVHGAGALASSINMSLGNRNMFAPESKVGLIWGQIPVWGRARSWLGLSANRCGGPDCALEATFYGPEGELARRAWRLPAGGALVFDAIAELQPELGEPPRDAPAYVWYLVRSARPDISAVAVTRHDDSGHTSGEHNF